MKISKRILALSTALAMALLSTASFATEVALDDAKYDVCAMPVNMATSVDVEDAIMASLSELEIVLAIERSYDHTDRVLNTRAYVELLNQINRPSVIPMRM